MDIKNIIQNKIYYGNHTLYERMKQWHIPAVSFAIIKDYEIIETHTYGVKRRGKSDIVTADTLFQAAKQEEFWYNRLLMATLFILLLKMSIYEHYKLNLILIHLKL